MNNLNKHEITYVINTYNRKKKLINAIDSVIKQKEVNIHILVIDDCSTDFDIKDLQNIYCKVEFHRNETNIGLAKSRQKGLDLCRTELIAFLDDDDELIDNLKTRRHIDTLRADKNIALVCSNIIEYNGEGYNNSNIKWPVDLHRHLMRRNGIIYPSTTTCRKCYFIEVGGFDFRFKRGIDSDVYRRIIRKGYSIIYDPTPTINYLVDAKDKITDDLTVNGLYKNIASNSLTIKKYSKYYLCNFSALYTRVKSITLSFYLIVKIKVGN